VGRTVLQRLGDPIPPAVYTPKYHLERNQQGAGAGVCPVKEMTPNSVMGIEVTAEGVPSCRADELFIGTSRERASTKANSCDPNQERNNP